MVPALVLCSTSLLVRNRLTENMSSFKDRILSKVVIHSIQLWYNLICVIATSAMLSLNVDINLVLAFGVHQRQQSMHTNKQHHMSSISSSHIVTAQVTAESKPDITAKFASCHGQDHNQHSSRCQCNVSNIDIVDDNTSNSSS